MDKALRILVLGSTTAKEYAIIRSLGRAGHRVAVTFERGASAPFLYSRYIAAKLEFPPKTDTAQWLKRLEAVLDATAFDLVIPTDDYTIINIFARDGHLAERHNIILPPKASWDATYYKDQTFALARELGIPCPRYVTVSVWEDRAVEMLDLRLPVIVKPLSSKVQCGNQLVWARHTYAESREQLERKLKALLAVGPAVVQEFRPGIGLGQGFIMQRGRVKAAFQYERVHEPPQGGASSYRKSVPIDGRVLSYSKRILARLEWTGPVMVEYKLDKASGEINLIEINGRFWGSLPLSIAAGMDMPRILIDAHASGRQPPRCDYRSGICCRNLEKDLAWLRENLKRTPKNPLYIYVPVKDLLKEPLRLLTGKEYFDEINLDDPRPGIMTLNRILRQFRLPNVRRNRPDAAGVGR